MARPGQARPARASPRLRHKAARPGRARPAGPSPAAAAGQRRHRPGEPRAQGVGGGMRLTIPSQESIPSQRDRPSQESCCGTLTRNDSIPSHSESGIVLRNPHDRPVCGLVAAATSWLVTRIGPWGARREAPNPSRCESARREACALANPGGSARRKGPGKAGNCPISDGRKIARSVTAE